METMELRKKARGTTPAARLAAIFRQEPAALLRLGLGLALLVLLEDEPVHEELAEEDEVHAVHEAGVDEGAVLLAGLASAPRVVRRRGADGHASRHLRNLEHGDGWDGEPLRHAMHGRKEVVAVHQCVHAVVHGAEEEAQRRLDAVGMPAEHERRSMVEPVEEDDLPLLEDEQHGIEEFRVLAEHKELQPHAGDAAAVHVPHRPAHVLMPAVGVQVPEQVRHRAHHAGGGEDAKQQVPCRDERSDLQRITAAHVLLQGEDADDVG
mmetsp:Transcript_21625/g.66139  ORF Transcript_21625/g.66139 Transcript_21625/m.66139 type:complete len:265 (-) Transcript_21625:401-1195(-)